LTSGVKTVLKPNSIELGVGDLGACNTKGTRVKATALDSSVAVIVMDPKTRTVGVVIVALPDSRIRPERAKDHPGYFADTGIPALLKEMSKLGCPKLGKGCVVKLVGGAEVADMDPILNIGKQTALAVKKVLSKLRLRILAEDLGKKLSRTVTVDVDRGHVLVSSPGRGEWEV